MRYEDGDETASAAHRGDLRPRAPLRPPGRTSAAPGRSAGPGTSSRPPAPVVPALLGLAAAAGSDHLNVVRRPTVDLLVIGDELDRRRDRLAGADARRARPDAPALAGRAARAGARPAPAGPCRAAGRLEESPPTSWSLPGRPRRVRTTTCTRCSPSSAPRCWPTGSTSGPGTRCCWPASPTAGAGRTARQPAGRGVRGGDPGRSGAARPGRVPARDAADDGARHGRARSPARVRLAPVRQGRPLRYIGPAMLRGLARRRRWSRCRPAARRPARPSRCSRPA